MNLPSIIYSYIYDFTFLNVIILTFNNFVIIAIHCQWSEWTEAKYEECSRTCGTGKRMRKRYKEILEANGGHCIGNSTKEEECNLDPCPGNHLSVNLVALSSCNKLQIRYYLLDSFLLQQLSV